MRTGYHLLLQHPLRHQSRQNQARLLLHRIVAGCSLIYLAYTPSVPLSVNSVRIITTYVNIGQLTFL